MMRMMMAGRLPHITLSHFHHSQNNAIKPMATVSIMLILSHDTCYKSLFNTSGFLCTHVKDLI